MPKLVDYEDLLDRLVESVRQERDMKISRRLTIKRRLDVFLERSDRDSLAGEATCAKLYEALDSCGLERTATQRMFHRHFITASLPHVYGKETFNKFKERILNSHGIAADDYNQYTLISTPRRWGKTTSVALFIACMLHVVPNAWVSVFSTGRRASKALAEQAHKYLLALAGDAPDRTFVKNTEELFVRGDSPADVRRLFSYPATVQVSI
jgi:hypothetical protein